MWIDHTDADRMAVAHDGGVSISENRGRSWFKIQLPIAQMYHVTVDDAIPTTCSATARTAPRREARAAPSPAASSGRGSRAGCGTESAAAESGFATPGPGGSQHRLVERFRRRRRRRDRGPLRRADAAVPAGRGLAREHARLAGGDAALPLPVGLSAHDLAPRPEHRLCRQPACAPDHRTAARAGRRSART